MASLARIPVRPVAGGVLARALLSIACLASAGGLAGQDGTAPEPRFEIGAELRFRGETRSGNGVNPEGVDSFALSRLRLNLGLRPAKHVGVVVQAQDARVAGLDPGGNPLRFHNLGFRQLYVAFGHESGPVTLRAGRQELDYFEGRLIGARGWSNTTPVWDGGKLILRRGEDSVDVFAVSHATVREGPDFPTTGTAVAGAVGSIRSWVDGLRIEPFVLLTRQPVNAGSNVGGRLRTIGSRFSGMLDKSWDYEFILMGQGGHVGGLGKRAWSATTGLGRTFERLPARPRLGFEWSHGSGDANPLDRTNSTFEPFFISRHRHYGEQDLVALRNLQYLNGGVRIRPREGLEIEVEYISHRLASRNDGLYAASNALEARAPEGGASTGSVGSELDAVLRYRPVERLQLVVGVFRFFAGPFVERHVPGGESQTYLYTSLVVQL
ncbi:MAG: hypothetical protein F4Y47_19690 [Acidobacteriia bacterium]|nr:hypothetical protein [Terriglobia bacterium]MYG01132.1 hypothetical protein [Terriglobia bacterium]MYK10636.1 hypothetical protein [Terriglobia bacterium]